MRQKSQEFKCDECRISISLPHPKCQQCGKQMSAFGEKFFDHLTIHHIRRSPLHDEDGKRYYVFALSVGGVLINGMTFNASNGSVKFPSTSHGRSKVRYVSAPGALVNVIREKVKQRIEEVEGEDALAA